MLRVIWCCTSFFLIPYGKKRKHGILFFVLCCIRGIAQNSLQCLSTWAALSSSFMQPNCIADKSWIPFPFPQRPITNPGFKVIRWLHGWLSLSSFRSRWNKYYDERVCINFDIYVKWMDEFKNLVPVLWRFLIANFLFRFNKKFTQSSGLNDTVVFGVKAIESIFAVNHCLFVTCYAYIA